MRKNPLIPLKRSGLVLLVCLSLQVNAAAMPYVHVHADAGHETDHHEGRTVHRHVATHLESPAASPAGHQAESHTDHAEPAAHSFSVTGDWEPAPHVLVGVTALPRIVSVALASRTVAFSEASLPPSTPRHGRGRSEISPPPDLRTSPLRGPPR